MYTLKINEDNTVTTTVKEKLVERSNYVDNIQIVTSKLYREQIDMTDCTVYMRYVLPVTNKIKIIQLTLNNDAYENDYLQYLIPADAYITAEAGDIEVSFTFLKLVSNEDDSTTSYVRKTQSGVIHISPLAAFAKFEPHEMLDEVDQRLIQMIALEKDMLALSEATYNGMVQDIHINDETRKAVLIDREGNDTGEGIEISNLSTYVAEDLVGKDPDGTQDGVTNIDNVPGIASLDDLLK